jgi:Leucine-rich repeat (LRR) protein
MSFLQEVEEHDLSKKELEEDGNVKYMIHELVHDLAQSVARDEVQTITSNQVNGHTEGCCYVSLADDMGAPEVIQSMFRRVRAFHSWGYNLDIKLVLRSRCLRVLDLGGSPITELPQMVGKLKHLRYLDVSSSPIETLPNSISSLHNLHTLYLSNCSNLCILPMSICNLQNLETLNLSACSLQKLPDSIGDLQNLGNLNMSFCNFLETLPNSIGKLQNLRTLNLKGCGKLQSLPDDICSLQNLQFFNLSRCGILQELPRNIGNLSNLYHLNLSQCNDLKSIPDSIRRIRRLHTLNMSHCSSLSEIPVSIGGLKELQFLILSHHSSSLSLPISTGHLPNLQTLDLSWNIDLEELPESIGNLHNLKILILFQCWSLSRLPDSISNLVMLESLNLVGCEQLTKLPDGIISISNLKHLRNDQCSALERLPHGFGQWTKLETLSLLTVGDKNSSIAELEHLNILTGQLRIECQSPMKDPSTDAMRANLRKKKKLSSLTLSWTRSCSIEELISAEAFLEVLMPPENLEVFEIDGYLGTKFSSWMMNSMELLLPNLVSISFSNIHHCSCLPHLGHFPHLQSLQLRHITGVHSMDSEMPVKINHGTLYRSLKELHFEDMPNLEIWLTSPVTDHKDKEPDLFKFPVLKTVSVTECPMLTPQPCLPDAIADLSVSGSCSMLSVGRIAIPPSSLLRRLWIKNCHVSSNEWRLLRHRPKLEDLVIEYCERLHILPEDIRSLTNLRRLKILNCRELKALPEWLGELATLESLEIRCCPKLVSLPKGLQGLTALEELTITGCSPDLNERCTKATGRDWFKICHVPSIIVS